jgi:hypothetical protein
LIHDSDYRSLYWFAVHCSYLKTHIDDDKVRNNLDKCLEAHRKLLELSKQVEQCIGTGDEEKAFREAYNSFRQGLPEDE